MTHPLSGHLRAFPWTKMHKAAAELDRITEENAELRGALSWYCEQARLCRLIHSEGDAGRHAISDDGGKRARAILAKHKGEG